MTDKIPAPGPQLPARLLIDTARFCQRGEVLEETDPVSRLPRLRADLANDDGECRWRLAGRQVDAAGGPEQWLDLTLDARLHVACDRCLQPVELSLAESRRFRLVADEATAARLDEEAEDYDVLVGGPTFDVRGLIEDEAIMMTPLSASHAVCSLPGGRPAEDPDGEAPPHPFAALATLRGTKDPQG